MKPHRDLNSLHAKFLHRNRGIFVDRSRVARFALVYSLPSMLWRDWAPLRTPNIPHREHFTAAARLLEDNRIMYEVLAFGHPDLLDSNASLTRLLDQRYASLMLPAVDAISDEQSAAVITWVRNGGHLYIWQNESSTGMRDEEMQYRAAPAFSVLDSDTGLGKVTNLAACSVTAYVTGTPGNSGDTLAAAIGEMPSQRQLQLVETESDKQASPLVWANVWSHGSGPMLSVQLVNYAVDTTHGVNLTAPLTIRLNISGEHGLVGKSLEALWIAPDYCNVSVPRAGLLTCGPPPPPTLSLLPTVTSSGLVEIRIPALQILGVVVITERGSAEHDTRGAAGEARKWLTRLSFASDRTPGADRIAAQPAILAATEVLDAKQGVNSTQLPSARTTEQLKGVATELKSLVQAVTQSHWQARATMMARTAVVSAVRRFDFTGGNAPSPPGWVAVLPGASFHSPTLDRCTTIVQLLTISVFPGSSGDGWSLSCGFCTANHSLAAGGTLEPLTGLQSLFGEWIRNRDPVRLSYF